MNIQAYIVTLLLTAFSAIPIQSHSATTGVPRSPVDFRPGKQSFMLGGKPFVIKAAELHYPRIPRPYWEQRIQMCKALGMNTICLYVFWNVHESEPDIFDFSGQNDLRSFIELCRDNGMYVILRPGPYVCAEWEMGGLPWWLLNKKDIRLRESDPWFLERVRKFEDAVAGEVGDLTAPNGGPIIMIQVENEYGSYGIDRQYISAIRDMLRDNYGDITLFQCDWSTNFLDNGLDDLVWTLNFGTGADIDSQFAPLREARPDAPLMCSEYWSGWFDKWGANHETRPEDEMIAGIDEMLSKDISFSLYMTHGGTNWGHWAGANSPGFSPDVTSYDYDAPISESGAATPKYHKLRHMMTRHNGGNPLPPIPVQTAVISIPTFTLDSVAPLFDNLPPAVPDTSFRTIEEYGYGYGSILYRTHIPAIPDGARLTVTDVHDFARIWLDGEYVGSLDRRDNGKHLSLPPADAPATLDILVEAMGRINFGRAIKDFKGITHGVSLTVDKAGMTDTLTLVNEEVYPLPDIPHTYAAMSTVTAAAPNATGRMQPGLYRGSFVTEETGDTFLDFSTWGKGLVYVNGHPLGRIWDIGPQQTLYMPGCWLRKGRNDIMVFDITGPRATAVAGLTAPVLDRLGNTSGHTAANYRPLPDFDDTTLVAEGVLGPGNGWKQVDFGAATGRILVIEALSPHDSGSQEAAIAEIYLLDNEGSRMPREDWTPRYADSEDTATANRSADKAYDLQESTYWCSAPGSGYPHIIAIDLGSRQTVSGLQLLPRADSGAPGSVARYRIRLIDETE